MSQYHLLNRYPFHTDISATSMVFQVSIHVGSIWTLKSIPLVFLSVPEPQNHVHFSWRTFGIKKLKSSSNQFVCIMTRSPLSEVLPQSLPFLISHMPAIKRPLAFCFSNTHQACDLDVISGRAALSPLLLHTPWLLPNFFWLWCPHCLVPNPLQDIVCLEIQHQRFLSSAALERSSSHWWGKLVSKENRMWRPLPQRSSWAPVHRQGVLPLGAR